MSVAWFVDGAYLFKCWGKLQRADNLDYVLLREHLESQFCDAQKGERIDEAYYFNADPEPPTARQNAFHNALAYSPPNGPGLRVKLYWLQKSQLFWPKKLGGGAVVHPISGDPYEVTQQKGVDVGLAFNLMKSFGRRGWKKLFLAAGDGDFSEVVQHLVENEGVNLVLVGTVATISAELRPYASQLVELDKLAPNLARARSIPGSAAHLTPAISGTARTT